jgi:molecular chaperone IbpA
MIHQFFGKDFDRLFVGFDEQLNRMSKLHDEITRNIPNYPPYNIKKVDENRYVIEMAVAGFSKSEIDIEFADDKLIVRGKAKEDDQQTNYLFNGLANRAFTRSFVLNDQVEIKGAALTNGLLQIGLERIIPEHKKPRKIEVSDEPSTVTEFAALNTPQNPELLLEKEEVPLRKAASRKSR